jgi:hypothetical protein
MNPVYSYIGRLSWLAMVLAIAALSPLAKGQDEDEPEPPDGGRRDARAELRLRVRRHELQRRLIQIETIEQFQNRLDRDLTKQVNWAEREFELTEAQKTKLILAGRGDIKRVLDRRLAIDARIRSARDDSAEMVNCEREAMDLQGDLERGIFRRESLFAKTMATTVTAKQRADARKHETERHLAGYRMAVADAALRLTPALGLSDEQARHLKKLLTEEIDPPQESGESDHAYIMFHFAQLPDAKVKPIFNDSQWRLLSEFRRSWASREWFAKRTGS